MAHANIFNYGLGYYGGSSMAGCAMDQSGHCAQPLGPSFPGVELLPAIPVSIKPFSPQQKLMWQARQYMPTMSTGMVKQHQMKKSSVDDKPSLYPGVL